MAVRRAFPTVLRRKIGVVHYYCGLQFTSHSIGALTTWSCMSINNVPCEVRDDASTSMDAASRSKIRTEIKRSSTGSCEQHREHNIASININLSELQTTNDEPTLGEGTFAKCVLGRYKRIQVAVKIFKGRPLWKTVHNEANIMMKIPSHPGIPMFIGLFTLHYPYLLVTKFHHYSGRSLTFSDFIKNYKKKESNTFYHLLCSLLDAIMHIHQSGILHNDIKGNNVVVEKSNAGKHCILIEFGKACTLKQSKGMLIYVKESSRHVFVYVIVIIFN